MKNVNFFAKAVSIYCICLLSATVTVHSATKDMTNGKWTIRFNDETRKSEFVKIYIRMGKAACLQIAI